MRKFCKLSFLLTVFLMTYCIGFCTDSNFNHGGSASPSPDLIIDSITVTPERLLINQQWTIIVVVKNQGSAAAGGFWTDWYDDLTAPPGAGDNGFSYRYLSVLNAGGSNSWTFNYISPLPGDFQTYAQTDTTNAVAEADESNNVLGPVTVHVNEFEFIQEAQNTTMWFGGDDIITRNAAAGQSFKLPRSAMVDYAGFRFKDKFDYANNPSGIGHAVTLVLNIRAADGTIVKTVAQDVSASFAGGWVYFDLDTQLWGGETYIFTCYVQDGHSNKLSSAIYAQNNNPWPDSQGYGANINTNPYDMEEWSNWNTQTLDFNFRIAGIYNDLSRADFNQDYAVNLTDFTRLATFWLENTCVQPSWCQQADFDYSGLVDAADLRYFSSQWLWDGYGWYNNARIQANQPALGADEIYGSDGQDFWPGTYFIYKTNQGRFGKFIVEKLDKSNNNKLTIGFTSYNADGTIYIRRTGLAVPGNSTCDLDNGNIGDAGTADFGWVQSTAAVRYLSPRNEAVFKMIYRAP